MMTPIIGRLTLTDGMRRPVSGRYAGDVEAKLLTFGAILCAGSTSDARALFASIDPEKMLALFRFPTRLPWLTQFLLADARISVKKAISLLASLQQLAGTSTNR